MIGIIDISKKQQKAKETNMKIASFLDVIDGNYTLSDVEIEQIITLCGFRGNRKATARRCLNNPQHTERCGIMSRLELVERSGVYKWNYNAGQDQNNELKVVRDVICGKR